MELLFTGGHLNVKFGDERATYQTVLLPVLPLEEAEACCKAINKQDINNHHHHPISDHRSVADRVSGKNDDDDDDAHNQNQKGPAVKSEAGRKLPAEPEPGERRVVHAPEVGPANPEGNLEPNARQLIAELVSEYRETVPPEKHCKDDHAFIERLYCEFGGYCDVYLGINELGYRVAHM